MRSFHCKNNFSSPLLKFYGPFPCFDELFRWWHWNLFLYFNFFPKNLALTCWTCHLLPSWNYLANLCVLSFCCCSSQIKLFGLRTQQFDCISPSSIACSNFLSSSGVHLHIPFLHCLQIQQLYKTILSIISALSGDILFYR